MDGDFCYSWNGEEYSTVDDELSFIFNYLDCFENPEVMVGNVYWKAQYEIAKHSDFISVENLIEDMQVAAFDSHGEWSEDYLSGLDNFKLKELEVLITNWFDNNVNINFFSVKNAVECEITKEHIEQYFKEKANE